MHFCEMITTHGFNQTSQLTSKQEIDFLLRGDGSWVAVSLNLNIILLKT